ncbi:MAG: glycerate kinase [Anaerolineaceae bacterium]|nr:glycerate kinase [Anaerolineaceae bacterium]
MSRVHVSGLNVNGLITNSIRKLPGADSISRVLEAALRAADPAQAVMRHVQRRVDKLVVGDRVYDLACIGRIFVIGFGKAVLPMAEAVLGVLDDCEVSGVLIAKEHSGRQVAGSFPAAIRVVFGTHPIPSEMNVESTQQLLGVLKGLEKNDLVICLVSGGGSALFTLPAPGVDLVDLMTLTERLLVCGADIREVNTLRKHIDLVKGGGLARLTQPAKLVTLILSDVVGNPLDVIASGPTAADTSSYQDALNVLKQYDLLGKTPKSILAVLKRGAAGELPETLKNGDPALERCYNLVIGSNLQATEAALANAQTEGFNTLLLTSSLQGEASQAGMVLGSILRQMAQTGQPMKRPACVVAGGETTVTLRGSGRGGRNQELALGAVPNLDGMERVVLVTLATDGEDGPTDAAGAIISGETLTRASLMGLNYREALRNNDSYSYFDALGDLIRTGATGTNVNDLTFLFTLKDV